MAKHGHCLCEIFTVQHAGDWLFDLFELVIERFLLRLK